MSDVSFLSLAPSDNFDNRSVLATVQTAISTLRLGMPILIERGDVFDLCLAVDSITEDGLTSFKTLQIGRAPMLILSDERGEAIGLGKDAHMPVSMGLKPQDTAEMLITMAMDHPAKALKRPSTEEPKAQGAIQLLLSAKLLPACLYITDVSGAEQMRAGGMVAVSTSEIAAYPRAHLKSLKRRSEAPIPVRGGINTRMVVFEYASGENEIGLIVGKPDLSKPLPIRIHSSCATGDIFGSERCDCGDQLRMAIEKLDEIGGGAVIYLNQEGRGIGLVNKIRAYDLQDQALDTVDANRALGFEDDLRRYGAAAAMVQALGWSSVSILTNNPKKVAALESHGMEVIERIEHQAPVNKNNQSYLRTKAERSGHLLKYNK